MPPVNDPRRKSRPPEPLSPAELRRSCDADSLSFASTADLPPLAEIIGQERALRAVSFGIDIDGPGYHMFALGPAGTGKTTTIRGFLAGKAKGAPTPDDWLYVNNFEDGDRPRAIHLPAGRGCRLRKDVDRLVEELKTRVPRAFEGQEYEDQKQKIIDELERRRKEMFRGVEEAAEAGSVRLLEMPQGVAIVPVRNGEALGPDEIAKLSDKERETLERTQKELQERIRTTMREVERMQKEGRGQTKALDRQVAAYAVGTLIDDLKEQYRDQPAVLEYLDAVREDILENVQELKQMLQQQEGGSSGLPFLMQGHPDPDQTLDRYRVNLIVDHCENGGAPIVHEINPTHPNLVGRLEHKAQFGGFVTNFHLIKAGALHRANGGYLILEAIDVLLRPFAWDALKRSLKNGFVRIESAGESYGLITTRSLEPEPIPLQVKVILLGDPFLYYLLQNADPDFGELFKVEADFAQTMEWTPETVGLYARFIGDLCRNEKLRHLDPGGVARVVEESSRMVDHQGKLSTRFGRVVDLIREASYWAGKRGAEVTGAEDVTRAVAEKIHRADRIEERLREMIAEGTLLIDTRGEAVGQVNGLAVLSLGGYAFGKPSRITASTFVGGAGIVSIDREAKFGGRIHNKGAMILAGYLGGIFAQQRPLALSATIAFEQLYEEVEGDSASSTELYALLSSLSELPLRQDLAVTGSVNQHGRIQAIGGVNQKIEGYFALCKLLGLTGKQGVLIPRDNVRHLMLRDEVVAAVRDGKFHIYPVTTVAEGIALLTGVEAGEPDGDGRYPAESVFGRVQGRLEKLTERVREFGKGSEGKGAGEEKEGGATLP